MADPYAQAVGFSRFSLPGPQGLKAPYIPEIPVHYRVPGLTMDLRPELTIALERASLCCPVIRKCLADSVEASHSAVKHAHDAWDQLESVTCNLMSVFELVDQPGLEVSKLPSRRPRFSHVTESCGKLWAVSVIHWIWYSASTTCPTL